MGGAKGGEYYISKHRGPLKGSFLLLEIIIIFEE
jgi:hypothetical protein